MHISMSRKLIANMWRSKWLIYMEISLILKFFLHPRWKNRMAAAWLPATLFSRFDFMLWSYLQIQVNSPVDFLKTYVHKWLWVLVQVCIIYTSNMSVAYWRQFDASRMSLLSLDGWPEIAKTTGRYYPTGYITHLNQQKTWLFPASLDRKSVV